MVATTTLSLKSLLVPSKSVEVEYPGMPGFMINVCFLSRETIMDLRKKCTKITFDSKTRKPVEGIDDKLFLSMYVDSTIKGWKGLKLSYLEQLAPVELGNADLDAELTYSQEEALSLMQASSAFDSFISDMVTDLGNFSSSNAKK